MDHRRVKLFPGVVLPLYTPYRNLFVSGSKGWRRSESTRLLPMWPGSNPCFDAICGLSLLLVLAFAPRGFSPGTPVFPSPQKPAFANSNSTRNQVDEKPLCGCATSKSSSSLLVIIFCWCFKRTCLKSTSLVLKRGLKTGMGFRGQV